MQLSFASPVTGFGADFAGLQSIQGPPLSQISVAGQVYTPSAVPLNAVQFIGFVSDTAFSTVTFSSTLAGPLGDGFGMDNVTFGNVAAVAPIPEPQAWALMLAGLGAIGWTMRRQRKA